MPSASYISQSPDLKLIPNCVPACDTTYTWLILVKSVAVKLGVFVSAFQVPIYFNKVDGRFCSGTLPPLSKPQYPLLTPLFNLFSGVYPILLIMVVVVSSPVLIPDVLSILFL